MRAAAAQRNRRRLTAATLVIVGAIALFATSRLPFFARGPDWSILSWEHCFLLSFPMVYENRRATDPDEHLPYWVVNQDNMRGHYHAGMGWVAHAIGWMSRATGSRGLWLVRLLGTAMAAVFVASLAWALTRLWSVRRQPFQVLVPLFLCAVPPPLFLWATLTPEGHYYDSHLFYGLFLPFYIAVSRGRFHPLAAVLAGLLGGVAIVYTFSNAVFVIALVGILLLSTGISVPGRLARIGLTAFSTLAVLALIGQPATILGRLMRSNDETTPGAGASLAFSEWVHSGLAADAAKHHVGCLFGLRGAGLLDGTTHFAGRIVALTFLVVFVAGLMALAWSVVPRPGGRADPSPASRFLALNGLLASGFIGAYLLFDPYTMPDDVYLNISYLLPAFPMLFVGAGTLFQRLCSSNLRGVAWISRMLVLALGVLLVAGWANALRVNSRPIQRPDFQRCDSMHIQGYFWDPPEQQRAAVPITLGHAPVGAILDTRQGLRRCLAHHAEDGETCLFLSYVLDARHQPQPIECGDEPDSRAMSCARAQGAARYGWKTCGAPWSPPADLCREFEGSLRSACISGAYQGTAVDWSVAHCIESLVSLCEAQFDHGTAARSACMEQTAALVEGMPALPEPVGDLPSFSERWPDAWHGLLERALVLGAETPRHPLDASCEDLYYLEYERKLPEIGQLAYDQCLTLARDQYAWCAIGVARIRGETDCVWEGHPLGFEAFP